MIEKNNIENALLAFQKGGYCSDFYFCAGSLTNLESRLEVFSSQTVFDLSSLTKALFATPILFELQKQGVIDLEGDLSQFALPRRLTHLSKIKVLDILRHNSGLPAWRNFYVGCEGEDRGSKFKHIDDVLSRVAVEESFIGKDRYSDVGMILLYRLIEEKTKETPAELFGTLAYSELGIQRSEPIGFASNLAAGLAFAPSGYCKLREKEVVGEVQDENCWSMGGESFHAGMFGSGPAVVNYILHLCSTKLGQDIIAANAAFIQPGNPALLGWRQNNDSANCAFGGGLAMGHLGFTGCCFWLDVAAKRFTVLLTNRLVHGRNPGPIRKLRKLVFTNAQQVCDSCRW